jgi:hypothetical protein
MLPDENGDLLKDMMKGVAKHALCDDCRKKRDWYIRQGRYEDWKKGLP